MAEPKPGEQAIFNAACRIEEAEARRRYVEQPAGRTGTCTRGSRPCSACTRRTRPFCSLLRVADIVGTTVGLMDARKQHAAADLARREAEAAATAQKQAKETAEEREAVGGAIPPRLIPGVMDLRPRHFEKTMDAAGCRATAEMWEKLNRTDPPACTAPRACAPLRPPSCVSATNPGAPQWMPPPKPSGRWPGSSKPLSLGSTTSPS